MSRLDRIAEDELTKLRRLEREFEAFKSMILERMSKFQTEEWIPWTPALGGGHVLGTGGSISGFYSMSRHNVKARMIWVLGTSFTVNASGTISLPVEADTTDIQLGQVSFPLGTVIIRDAGSSTFFGHAIILSSTTFRAGTWDIAHVSGYPRFNSLSSATGVPHTYVAGDTIEAYLDYQAAQ